MLNERTSALNPSHASSPSLFVPPAPLTLGSALQPTIPHPRLFSRLLTVQAANLGLKVWLYDHTICNSIYELGEKPFKVFCGVRYKDLKELLDSWNVTSRFWSTCRLLSRSYSKPKH
ncbi:hypothetical protein L1049_017518 [Liquidambar formosana]|uniref:Uncharacterized protein n=1 Tax=Liquidambar formosana TaxID=63359 RepID=A0AAP0S203_LIQFO